MFVSLDVSLKLISPVANLGLPSTFGSGMVNTPLILPAGFVISASP